MSRSKVQLRAVVFDLDGTLVDTMPLILDTYVHTIHSLGGPVVTTDDILGKFHIGPTPVVLKYFLGRSISADDMECYHTAYEQAIAGLQPFPGVVDMVEELSGDGYRLGLFTSATRRAATRVLATTGLDRCFRTVVGGDEIIHPKPASDGLELACRRLGVDPVEAAYVGDAPVDLECARYAGVLAIHARWGGAVEVKAGDHIIADHPVDILAYIKITKAGHPDEPATSV
jgi:HAD superfamily hydrolase (TIGR01549 family)